MAPEVMCGTTSLAHKTSHANCHALSQCHDWMPEPGWPLDTTCKLRKMSRVWSLNSCIEQLPRCVVTGQLYEPEINFWTKIADLLGMLLYLLAYHNEYTKWYLPREASTYLKKEMLFLNLKAMISSMPFPLVRIWTNTKLPPELRNVCLVLKGENFSRWISTTQRVGGSQCMWIFNSNAITPVLYVFPSSVQYLCSEKLSILFQDKPSIIYTTSM